MPPVFSVAAQVASGSYTFNANGSGPCRLFVTARGGALASCGVALNGVAIPATAFDSLGEDQTAQLWIDAPCDEITLTPVGTSFDAALSRALHG